MPITRIAPGRLRLLFVPALAAYMLAWLPFLLVGEPNEMVRLQLAGSESKAKEIVTGWSHAEVVDMAFLQGVDNVHLLTYGLLLITGAVWAGRRLKGRLARWASLVAWMGLTTAALDALENVGMIVMIRGDFDSPVPTLTTALAVAKFSMFSAVLAYIGAGVVAHARTRRGSPSP